MLPLVVEAIGTDIQIRTSHLDYRPPYPDGIHTGGVGLDDGESVGDAVGALVSQHGR